MTMTNMTIVIFTITVAAMAASIGMANQATAKTFNDNAAKTPVVERMERGFTPNQDAERGFSREMDVARGFTPNQDAERGFSREMDVARGFTPNQDAERGFSREMDVARGFTPDQDAERGFSREMDVA